MKEEAQVLYQFSGFQLDPEQRVLSRHGEPVTLAPKCFEILLFLVQNRRRILEKEELMKALWPESFVEEGNLSQNIFILRKVLGDDQNGNSFIQTVPRRGYKFIAPVTELDVSASGTGAWPAGDYWRRHSPFRGLQVFEPDDAWLFFGRDAETRELLMRLERSPVLMVAGNSGCGKSSLIRAGLVPALRAGGTGYRENRTWRTAILRPSGAPFDYLAEVLPGQLAPELGLRQQAAFIADCRSNLPLGGEALRNAISCRDGPPAGRVERTRGWGVWRDQRPKVQAVGEEDLPGIGAVGRRCSGYQAAHTQGRTAGAGDAGRG